MSDEQAQPDEHTKAAAEEYVAGLSDAELADLLARTRYPADPAPVPEPADPKTEAADRLRDYMRRSNLANRDQGRPGGAPAPQRKTPQSGDGFVSGAASTQTPHKTTAKDHAVYALRNLRGHPHPDQH